MAEQFKVIHPIKYYRDFINHNVRPDGREFDQFRPVRININSIGTADGSAIVKIGHTTVVCGIKAELAQPSVTEPDIGYVVPNIDLTPISSAKYRPGLTNDDAQVLSCTLNDIIVNSNWIDLKSLCVAKEKLSWVLYCDITCLDHDGSVLDAAVIALIGALKSLKLPEIQYDTETDNYNVFEDKKCGIKLNESAPVATTFSVFDDKILLTDPDADEEELSSTTLTVAVCNGEICLMNKPGGCALTPQQIEVCLQYANKREHSICKLINSILEKK